MIYSYINQSNELKELIIKSDKFRTDYGFVFRFIYLAIKYVPLIIGVSISVITSYYFLKENNKF